MPRFLALMLGLMVTVIAVPAPATSAGALPSAAEEEPAYGRIMLLLDSSGSMAEKNPNGKTKISEAKTALRSVIKSLPEEVEVGFRVFGAGKFKPGQKGACTDSQLVVTPALDNRSDLTKAVDSYKPSGETPIPYALEQAAKDLGPTGERSIILISDGESSCAPDPCITAEKIRASGVDLKIDVVGLSVGSKTRKQLQCVASEGGGKYYDAKNSEELKDSIAETAEREVPPFALTGEAIKGGSETAPTPIKVGDWIDSLGAKGSSSGVLTYSFERVRPDTTLRVSAITQGERGDEGISIELYNDANVRCDFGTYTRKGDTKKILGVQAVAAPSTACGETGTYRIVLSRTSSINSNPIDVGLRVSEEPAIVGPGFATTERAKVVAPEASNNAKRVLGGSSFQSATKLDSGTYSTTIQPGGMLFFRVPLSYGQSVRVSTSFDTVAEETQQAVGMFGLLAELTLYNPMQAVAADPEGSRLAGTAGGPPVQLVNASPPVSSTSFTRAYPRAGDYDYTIAGDYYIGVSLQSEDYVYDFPLTITVAIDGEAQEAVSYAEGVSWTLADGASYPDADPTAPNPSTEPETEEESPEAAPAEDGGSGIAGNLKVFGILLLLGGGGYYLLKRRNAS